MPLVKGIKALSYDFDSADLSQLVCPPYDVISTTYRDQLLARHPHAAIRLEDTTADTNPYATISNRLQDWIAKRILVQHREERIFFIRETFDWNGKTIERYGMLALIELVTPRTQNLFAHEKVLPKAMEDRFNLLSATRTHISPIYLVYEDLTSASLSTIQSYLQNGVTHFTSDCGNVGYSMVQAACDERLKTYLSTLSSARFLIADGHHRYTSALKYAEQNGSIYSEARWMLAYMTPSNQKGIVLSSIQRLIQTDMELKTILETLSRHFRIQTTNLDPTAFEQSDAPFGLVDPKHQKIYLCFTNEEKVPTELIDAYLVKGLLRLDPTNKQDADRITYIKPLKELIDRASKDPGTLGILVKPLKVEEIFNVVSQGTILPPKSTYFYPKICTGIAFHPFF